MNSQRSTKKVKKTTSNVSNSNKAGKIKKSQKQEPNKEEEKVPYEKEAEQKKKSGHYQKYSEKLFKHDKDSYMKGFIVPSKDKLMAICKLCDPMNQEPFLAQQVSNHIFTKNHYQNTPENERETELKNLKEYLIQGKQEHRGSNLPSNRPEQKDDEETKEYLEFLALCLSERLSFLQISKIGSFLKAMMNNKGSKLKFFSNHSFDKDLIPLLTTNCFGKYLPNKIFADITQNRYSISLDTNTRSGENICAIKVRYAMNEFDKLSQQFSNNLQDKIISIKKLGESCGAETLKNLIQENIFDNHPSLSQNLIGIFSDRGSSLVGAENGLVELLSSSLPLKNLHIPDPCHSFNLVIFHFYHLFPQTLGISFLTFIITSLPLKGKQQN